METKLKCTSMGSSRRTATCGISLRSFQEAGPETGLATDLHTTAWAETEVPKTLQSLPKDVVKAIKAYCNGGSIPSQQGVFSHLTGTGAQRRLPAG